jgi:hypothetical protein
METGKTIAKPDWLTVAGLAVVAHALSVFIHEALGHGGTCVAVGCTPRLLTTMQFQGDEQSLPKLAVDAISAGGTIANLVAAVSQCCSCGATAILRAPGGSFCGCLPP